MLSGIDDTLGGLLTIPCPLGGMTNVSSIRWGAFACSDDCHVAQRDCPARQLPRDGLHSSQHDLASYDTTLFRPNDGNDLLYGLIQVSLSVDDEVVKLLETVHLGQRCLGFFKMMQCTQ